MALTKVTTNVIADNSINATKIADGAVTRPDIGYSGAVLQVVSTPFTTPIGYNNNYTDRIPVSNFFAQITPTSVNSKFLIIANLSIGFTNTPEWSWYISREVVGGATTDFLGAAAKDGNRMRGYHGGPNDGGMTGTTTDILSYSMTYLDSPSTTLPIRYQICFQNQWGNSAYWYINRCGDDPNTGYTTRGTSSITVFEISA